MKACSSCECVKPIEQFQVRKASRDGRTAACKVCLNARDTARYPQEHTSRQALQSAYRRTDAGRLAHAGAVRRWISRHPDARRAHILVNNAVRRDRLQKLPCFCCGEQEVEGHHPDYSRPLDVVWLCAQHHQQLHDEFEVFPLTSSKHSVGIQT